MQHDMSGSVADDRHHRAAVLADASSLAADALVADVAGLIWARRWRWRLVLGPSAW